MVLSRKEYDDPISLGKESVKVERSKQLVALFTTDDKSKYDTDRRICSMTALLGFISQTRSLSCQWNSSNLLVPHLALLWNIHIYTGENEAWRQSTGSTVSADTLESVAQWQFTAFPNDIGDRKSAERSSSLAKCIIPVPAWLGTGVFAHV